MKKESFFFFSFSFPLSLFEEEVRRANKRTEHHNFLDDQQDFP